MRWPVVWLGLSLFVVGCGPSDSPAQQQPTATSPPVTAIAVAVSGEIPFPVVSGDAGEVEIRADLNLPAPFQQRVQDRDLLDRLGLRLHQLMDETVPGPQLYQRQPRFEPESIRVVRDKVSAEQLDYWRQLPSDFTPLRGFRAPWGKTMEPWPAVAADQDKELAALIAAHLSEEGLMATLCRAVNLIGANECLKDPATALARLRSAGFPTDLLQFFNSAQETPDSKARVERVSKELVAGRPVDSLACELAMVPFHFNKSPGGFAAAEESGGMQLGMLRMQMGGGYRDGVVPGGAIDIMSQLAESLPEVNFLISVPAEFATDFRRLVRDFWPLQRPNHVTIVVEPLMLASWAQDNGKAGVIAGGSSLATLVPRYASQDEVSFRFLPGESLLARGLEDAGQSVIASPLLFQGGNVFVVRDPVRKQRVLLIGEAEIQRNRALGLTADQAVEAFKIEFGVDDCLVLPAVSFHLDYDISLREHRGRVIAFVNDSLSAARLILSRGVGAMRQSGMMPADAAVEVRDNLAGGQWRKAYEAIARIVFSQRTADGHYPDQLIQVFTDSPSDAPGANLRCFLTALDIVGSRVWTEENCPAPPGYGQYLSALRRLEEGVQRQRQLLEARGWTVASVPSMPDLESSVNYLNGIQDRERYLMPIYGGFYRSVDQVAMEVFRGVLGGQVKIVPIRSAGSQRRHGAVHCTAAAYPKL